MLNWNAGKVKNLSGLEIWLFILARVFIAFGLGVLATEYFPKIAQTAALPAIVLGAVFFVVATKGLFRETAN